MKKIKLTEIKEKYIGTVTEKDAEGKRIRVQKEMTRYVDVPFVDGWARFGHFLLDRVFYFIFSFLVGGVIGVSLGLLGYIDFLQSDSFETMLNILGYFIIQPLFYFIFELSMQSSPAKLILGRVVVNEYGEKPTAGQILGRSFARAVPFEAFSCLGHTGWHDNWSNTYVIRKKDLQHLKNLIAVQNFDTDPLAGLKASII